MGHSSGMGDPDKTFVAVIPPFAPKNGSLSQ
jgi:hypothetical protein